MEVGRRRWWMVENWGRWRGSGEGAVVDVAWCGGGERVGVGHGIGAVVRFRRLCNFEMDGVVEGASWLFGEEMG